MRSQSQRTAALVEHGVAPARRRHAGGRHARAKRATNHGVAAGYSSEAIHRLSGLGVPEELRAQVRTAGLPVIMLTSHSAETEEKAIDLGARITSTNRCKPGR